jgi:hypothetical protein
VDAAFTATLGAVYEPLGWLLKGATWEAAGAVSPAAVVAVSTALHTAASVLLLASLLALLPRIHRRYLPHPAEASSACALLACALYGIHPLRVEVVAWCSCQVRSHTAMQKLRIS